MASFAALGGLVIFLPIQIAALRLPRMHPSRYRTAAFKLTGFWLRVCALTGILMVFFFGAIILYELKTLLNIGCFIVFIASGAIYYRLRKARLRRKGIDLLERIAREHDWDA